MSLSIFCHTPDKLKFGEVNLKFTSNDFKLKNYIFRICGFLTDYLCNCPEGETLLAPPIDYVK